jgi:hypothetical protein
MLKISDTSRTIRRITGRITRRTPPAHLARCTHRRTTHGTHLQHPILESKHRGLVCWVHIGHCLRSFECTHGIGRIIIYTVRFGLLDDYQ